MEPRRWPNGQPARSRSHLIRAERKPGSPVGSIQTGGPFRTLRRSRGGDLPVFGNPVWTPTGGLPVATCPGWSILDLTEHLGRVHRWAEYLVRNLAQTRLPAHEVPSDRDRADSAWIGQGGVRLLATLRRTDPNLEMWAWGADQHVGFWSRRQLHETLIHRIDLQLAMRSRALRWTTRLQLMPSTSSWSTSLPPESFHRGSMNSKMSMGAWHSVTPGPERAGSFSPTHLERSSSHDDDPVDVEFTANGLDLLLALYRRRSLETSRAWWRGTMVASSSGSITQLWSRGSRSRLPEAERDLELAGPPGDVRSAPDPHDRAEWVPHRGRGEEGREQDRKCAHTRGRQARPRGLGRRAPRNRAAGPDSGASGRSG